MRTNTRNYFTCLLIGFLLLSIPISAQDNEAAEQVKANLLKVFELCQNNDDTALASYVVYRGDDPDRRWKDLCNADSSEEMARVVKIKERVNKSLGYGDHEFGEFISEGESEGTWYVWEVKFGGKPVFFAFLNINGVYALGDID